MNNYCAKALKSEDILDAYGINDLRGVTPGELLAKTQYQPVNPEFDKFAAIHWMMTLEIPLSKRDPDIFETWKSVCNGLFSYMAIIGMAAKNGQAKIAFKPFKRHPIPGQVDEIEEWLPFIRPMDTLARQRAKLIEVWDRHHQQRYRYVMWMLHDGSVDITTNSERAFHAQDAFDAVHWLKDNVYYSVDQYSPAQSQPSQTSEQVRGRFRMAAPDVSAQILEPSPFSYRILDTILSASGENSATSSSSGSRATSAGRDDDF